jgi:membrane protein required for beta-lactamase induction
MSFLVVLLALLFEQRSHVLEALRGPGWFRAYLEAFAALTRTQDRNVATAVAVVIVLLPAMVVFFVGYLLSQLWGGSLWEFIFAVVVLLFSIGPRDLHAQAADYIAAVQAGDEAKADAVAAELLDQVPPAAAAERSQAVLRAVLTEANTRLFAVLLWFALLGPGGALLYRCADFQQRARGLGGVEYEAAAQRLHGVLAWLPAHLVALGYALAGSFEDAVSDLKAYYAACSLQFFHVSNDVLVCTGLGAIRTAVDEEAGITRLKSALGLVRRTLVIWLVIYALLTLLGWSW